VSLKVFHIVFIVASIALAVFVGVWGVREYIRSSNTMALTMAIIAVTLGAAMAPYTNWFIRKMKSLPDQAP
jgi:hypothetical protein